MDGDGDWNTRKRKIVHERERSVEERQCKKGEKYTKTVVCLGGAYATRSVQVLQRSLNESSEICTTVCVHIIRNLEPMHD